MLKIKKNDVVSVISGNDKGKQGRVLAVLPDKMRVLVEGVNVRKRHMRPNRDNPQGQIISKEMPVHYSNVLIVDATGKPTRIGYKVENVDGKSVRTRIARTTGDKI